MSCVTASRAKTIADARERARQGAYNAWATEYRRLLRVFPILDDDRFDGEVKTGGIAFRHGFPCDARGRPL